MGVVFKARQRKPDRLVALKVIAAGELASPKLVERFRAETEAAASLDHPNIVSIYEVGEQSGFQFFSMRLVEGQTLGAMLAGKPMEPRPAAELLAIIARTVHYAHQRGILHRDLKPNNILIDAEGKPHLTDFGLAKLLERDTDLTLSGAVLGTPSYMAPEQAAGNAKQLTTAADVYSLGALFFEMLTGRPPFLGDSSLKTVRQVLETDPPRLSTLNARVPMDLETICLKCLEKEPVQRYGSAEALANDFERWLRHEPIQARPSTPFEHGVKWFRRNPARAGLYLTLFISLAGAWIASMIVSFRLNTARNQAEHHRVEAEQSAETSRWRLVQLNIQTGERLLQDMDNFGAQLWFLEALKLDQGKRDQEEPHRYLLESARRQSPRLHNLWFYPGQIRTLSFNQDGRRLMIQHADGIAVRDAATGKLIANVATRGLRSAAFDPEGNRVVTGGNDGTARVWDVATGREIGTPIVQQPGKGCTVVLHPNGREFFVYEGCEGARVGDVATGEFTGRAYSPEAQVVHACYSADGQRVLTLGNDRIARIWDSATGAAVGQPLVHQNQINFGLFSGDGSRVIVSEGVDGVLYIWDVEQGTLLLPPFRTGANAPISAAIPNTTHIVTTTYYGESPAVIWDVMTGKIVTRLQGIDRASRGVICSPDGSLAITISWDKTVRLWQPATGRYSGPILRHSTAPSAVTLSPDRRVLVAGDDHGTVRLWDIAAMQPASSWSAPGVTDVELRSDDRYILAACADGVARMLDVETGKEIDAGRSHGRHRLLQASFSADGQFIVTVDGHETVGLWNGGSPNNALHRLVHPTRVHRARFSPNGKHLATAGQDGLVRIWNTRNGEEVFTPLAHSSGAAAIHDLAYTPDGDTLLTAGAEGAVKAWRGSTGEPLWSVKLPGQVRRIAVNPEGTKVVAAVHDYWITPLAAYVFDVNSGQQMGLPLAHGDGVMSVEFSPDGKHLLTASEDRTTRIWETATGKLVRQVRRHEHWATSASFSRNGRHVVSSSNDKTALVWDVASGQVMSLPFRHPTDVSRAIFSGDGRRVLSIASDGLRCWELHQTDVPFEELMEEVQASASLRLDPQLGLVPLEMTELSNAWRRVELRR